MSRAGKDKPRLRVLLVEDVATDAELIVREIAREYTVEHRLVEDEPALRAALAEPWDVVVCDYRMPRFSAEAALRVLADVAPELPLLVVTGSISEDVAVECMKRGASDYLLKDRLVRLPQAIAGALEQRRLRRSQGESEAALKRKEQELLQSQKMEAIGRLAGGIAHDFNNLLTVVLGYAELLVEDLPANDPRLHDLGEILRASRRAAELTQKLLALSRRQVLDARATDLNEILRRMQDFLRRALGEDVQLGLHLAPDLGTVLADPLQMEQVLLNLCVNARDAMPGGGRLTIETENLELARPRPGEPDEVPAGRHVLVRVQDTGTGIPREIRERIFEPFFTTKPEGKGTGLGLSTVFGIVKQSGGAIQLESELGRGTTLVLALPRVAAKAGAAPQGAPVRADLRGSESVLIVEDEPAIGEFAELALERLGYRVLRAQGGEEALMLEKAHRGRLDLAVLDVVMPRIAGHDLARALRERRPDLTVLFVSGYGDERAAALTGLGPAVHLLRKPFTGQALAAKVREVIDASRTPAR